MKPNLDIQVEITANNPYNEPLLVKNEYGLSVLLQKGDSIRFPLRFNPNENQVVSVVGRTKQGPNVIKCKRFYLIPIDFYV